MPIYEFRCKKCGCFKEVISSFNNLKPPEKCDNCKEQNFERVVDAPSFKLNGDGWYKDGYEKSDSNSEDNN